MMLSSRIAGCLPTIGLVAAHAAFAQPDNQASGLNWTNAALLSDPVLWDSARREQTRNAAIVKETPGAWWSGEGLQKSLNQFGGQLKFGIHNVVREDGEQVIGVIREALTSKDRTVQASALRRVKKLSADGSPEAQTFIGFAYELGLFGVRANSSKAQAFYQAAAARHYQPAIYNLALDAAYGRGQGRSQDAAISLIDAAAAIAPDQSYRVCGFSAFLSYRAGKVAHALEHAKGCGSPLAGMVSVALDADAQPLRGERLATLRNSVATGVDDGYHLLERVAARSADSDSQLMYCKYALVNQYRADTGTGDLRERAAACVDQTIATWRGPISLKPQRDQLAGGIAGFVATETKQLAAIRQANHFHYSWPVPYLPFRQQDVDLVAGIMGGQR